MQGRLSNSCYEERGSDSNWEREREATKQETADTGGDITLNGGEATLVADLIFFRLFGGVF